MVSELQNILTGTCLLNEPMSRHTTYGIGGPADAFVIPKDEHDLRMIFQFTEEHSIPTTIMGSGSNLLVSDDGIRGIVIRLGNQFNAINVKGTRVSVGAGVMLGKLVKTASTHQLSGCESLVGIPGTVGGAIYMNAGAYNQEISVHLTSVDVMNHNGDVITIPSKDISFEYRRSSLSKDVILLRADFTFPTGLKDDVERNMKLAREKRKSSQPLSMRSAGSVFKNPTKFAAGYLIDQAGLKGLSSGDAQISEKHANFFVNTGTAKASDILSLIRQTRSAVKEKFEIDLELEIKLIGFKEGSLAV